MMATHRSHIAAISAHIVAMCCPHRYDDGPSFVMMTTHRSHIVAISAYIVAMCCPHRYDIIRNDDVHIATSFVMMTTHRSHIAAISALRCGSPSSFVIRAHRSDAMCCPHRYDDGPSFVMMATHRSHIAAISAHIAAMRCPHRYDDSLIIRNDGDTSQSHRTIRAQSHRRPIIRNDDDTSQSHRSDFRAHRSDALPTSLR